MNEPAQETPRPRRVALVIGNGAYRLGPPLANPTTDAVSVAGALERLGFDPVLRHMDLDKQGHDRAFSRMAALSKQADMAVVFFAGHGMEIDGENYLLPVDAELADAASLGFATTRLSDVMRAVEGASLFRFVILDACRDNPFRTRLVGADSTRSFASRGLAAVEPPGNTLVAYAARHGTTAMDGVKGANSPYTTALLTRLETANLDIRLMLGHVRDDVMRATGNQQQPFFYGTLGGAEVVLKRVAAASADTSREEQAQLLKALEEERDWERAQRSDSIAGLEEFLAAHPTGRFSEQARAKVGEKASDKVAGEERQDWNAALRSSLSSDFRAFKQKWPNGKFAAEADRRLSEVLGQEESYEFGLIEKSLSELSARKSCPNPAPLRAFLARHATSEKAAAARAFLEKLDDLHHERLEVAPSKAEAQLYLERFPEGRHLADVQSFLSGAGDDRAWIGYLKARDGLFSKKNRHAAIERYVADWPQGRHIAEALPLQKRFSRRPLRTLGKIVLVLFVLLVIAQIIANMNR